MTKPIPPIIQEISRIANQYGYTIIKTDRIKRIEASSEVVAEVAERFSEYARDMVLEHVAYKIKTKLREFYIITRHPYNKDLDTYKMTCTFDVIVPKGRSNDYDKQ